MPIDKASHVKSQLSTLSGRLGNKVEHDGIKIRCPYHANGRERTPSCKVHLTGNNIGGYFCFGCKTKGSWNSLANTLGLTGFKRADQLNDVYSFSIPEQSYNRNVNPELDDISKLRRYKEDVSWRKITTSTLALFDVRYARVVPEKKIYFKPEDFLFFPVYVNKMVRGGIYARRIVSKKTKEDGLISYINSKGTWSRVTLFGYDIAKKRKGPLWIVEGPRDCMKITQLGGRAVAIIGSYFGPEKARLVQALDPPCVISASDPDAAGETARKAMHKLLDGIPIYDAVFPEGKDPANFTIKSYNRMLRNLGLEEYIK